MPNTPLARSFDAEIEILSLRCQLAERITEIEQLEFQLDAARRQREAWKRQATAERKHSLGQEIVIAGLRGKMT